MSSYQQFVKAEMANLTESTMKPAEKMKHIATLWHKHKPAMTTKKTKTTKGGNFFDDIIGGLQSAVKLAPLIGLGMEPKKRKSKTKQKPDSSDSDSGSGGSLEGEKEEKRRTKKKKPILSKEITAILDKYNC